MRQSTAIYAVSSLRYYQKAHGELIWPRAKHALGNFSRLLETASRKEPILHASTYNPTHVDETTNIRPLEVDKVVGKTPSKEKKRSREKGKNKKELAVDEKDLQSAMGFCTRMEQESGFPVLAEYTEKQKAATHKRPIDLKNARNMFVEAVVAAKIKAMELGEEDSNEAKCLPGWADIDETDTQSARFSQQMMIWLTGTGFEKLALLATTGSGSAHSEVHDQVKMTDVADDDAAEFIEEKEEEQERKGKQAAIAPFIQEKETGKTKKRTKHQTFPDRVAKMSDYDVFTPRCNKLLELHDDILALNIITEAFRRRQSINIAIYSGVLSTKEMDDLLHKWQTVSHATTPIDFQAKAGGTGLTINEASQPWWNSLDALQAERRAVRIGQEKLVHVWVLTCANSFSDAIINTGALRKLRVIDKIMAALRTAKGAEVETPPHVPQFGMVPYIPYTRFREMDAAAMRQEEEKQARGATEAGKAKVGDERPSKRPRLPEGAYAEDHGAVEGVVGLMDIASYNQLAHHIRRSQLRSRPQNTVLEMW
ncbi:uncharacterized protein J4E88_007191 [Alternaria novae-zelandiae]|uniref:uncharacterized protein n=1 Tax=Alternaria novae-zelandiae TaxID=430562 RepID=UPI0020C3BD55|nr:uncharacterized protein J4E88_007191 [Alternaria novae-zelandiae]KAI4676277.1 hypothetical protein J4E88_007191 [Alternaria novae-zelandiae]